MSTDTNHYRHLVKPEARGRSATGPGGQRGAGMAGPEPGDRGQLAGLQSRRDLNGRRVEVKGPATGKDGAPRCRVELLFGAGAGSVLKVKAANLELDKDRALDPALNTVAAAMQALTPGAPPEEERRDWAGLPDELLAKIAETHISQTEAGWAAELKEWGHSEEYIQRKMAKRKRDGNCLFVFARVCKQWRKAQLKVGVPLLRTRVESYVAMPGSVALVKWALAEGCPRENGNGFTMAAAAAAHGHQELVRWLCREGGFAMDEYVMREAAGRGDLELVQRLRGEGCPWDYWTCFHAVDQGRVEVLRWARENGCPWRADTRHKAAAKLGYTDDLGNLVDVSGDPVQ